MKSKVSVAIAAIALAAGATSQASANIADLKNIRFEVADLNPGDGISPDYFLLSPAESGYFFILDGQTISGPHSTDGFLTAGDFTIPFGEWPNAGVSGSMSLGEVVVEADATGPGTASIDASSAGSIFVTPYTSLTLTANSIFQAIGGAGSESVNICLGTSCSGYQSFLEGTQSHAYSVTFSNDSDQTTGLVATIDVSAMASGVPELPTAVLLLAAGALFIRRPGKGRPSGHSLS